MADTQRLNLESVGITPDPTYGYIDVDNYQQTSVSSIFAVGDVHTEACSDPGMPVSWRHAACEN